MIALMEEATMKKHATKMGKRTAFHAEAERIHQINLRIASESERTVYVNAMLAHHRREQRRLSRSSREKDFFDAFKANSTALAKSLTEHAHPPIGLWRRLLERDDHRVYAARRTAIVDVAELQHALWWYRLSWSDQFELFELSQRVVADDAEQEIHENHARKFNRKNRDETKKMGTAQTRVDGEHV